MSFDPADLGRAIRREALAQMAMEIVNIPSFPTERQAAEYVGGKFAELGMTPFYQEVEEDRWNVVLRLPGSGGGRTLLLSGHLDTSAYGDDLNEPERYQVEATRDGDWLYGLGMSNMKSAFAAYYEAIRALQETKAPLRGDIIVAGVVGETERGAWRSAQLGSGFRANGLGSHHLATHGLTADCAIIGEPTAMHLALGETAMVFAKVTVTGSAQHTWCKEYGIDPIEKMQGVMNAIRRWEPELKRRYPHPFMDARLGIGAIEGGYPYKPSRCPAPDCSIFVDFRIPALANARHLHREFNTLLQSLAKDDQDLQVECDFYVTHPGYEVDKDLPVVQAIEHGHQTVFGEPVPYAKENRYCVSSDGIHYWQVGIPAITYGAGGVQREGQRAVYGGLGEALNLDNLQRCAQVYALAAYELCS